MKHAVLELGLPYAISHPQLAAPTCPAVSGAVLVRMGIGLPLPQLINLTHADFTVTVLLEGVINMTKVT